MEKLCTDCLIIANKVLPDLPLIKPVTSIENDTELNCSTTLPHVSGVVVSYIDNPLIKCFKDAQHFRGNNCYQTTKVEHKHFITCEYPQVIYDIIL